MNWEAISAIAESIGTIVVIITVVYLARQIHLNTVTNRVAGILGIADAARDIHFTVAGNRDTAEVFIYGIPDPDKLDEIDQERFALFIWGVLRQMESFYVQYEQGLIDEPTMKAYARLSIDLVRSNKIIKEHWRNSKDYSPAFKSWIDQQVGDSSKNDA